ncbi:MAG: hypothetical protein HQ567_25330 [Candidatus Nealsonbacteria bacterium]|nr:hypothetical protein [Candidatus Nealsonbacteria bacterium]
MTNDEVRQVTAVPVFVIRHSSFVISFGRTVTVALLAWLLLCGRWAGAVDGSEQTGVGEGLEMTVDSRWPAQMGYRPVRIIVKPARLAKPTTVDRRITVEFISLSEGYYRHRDTLAVSQEIELPAGFKQVETILSVPQVNPLESYHVQVREDGAELEKLSRSLGWSRQYSGGQTWTECLPAILFVSQLPIRSDRLASALPSEAVQAARSADQSGRSYDGSGSQLPTSYTLPPEKLPGRWVDYSGVDVICLSLDELAGLKANNKKAFDAIRRWAAAGGNLWVYGLGDNWQGMAQLERLLGLPSGLGEDGLPSANFWQPPDPSRCGRVAGRELMSQYDGYGNRVAQPYEPTMPPRERPRTVPAGEADVDGAKFLLRRYDFGLVAALAAKDPFPGEQADWAHLLDSVGSDRWAWYRRHGTSTCSDNADYANFLIPGVGLAPVTEFCILITLFVLAIGPLNYWLLRRWKRLHLLVVTIPAGAAAVTLFLFAYALISDGLGTRVRVRSVTHLDQRRGHATCWARLSYYSGLAPGGGLTFPDDVAVQPIQYSPNNDEVRNYRKMRWQGDQQLESGWLNSRTQVQYLTVRSRPSRQGVKLLRSPHDPTKAQVKNELGARIEQLAICGDDGACYWAEGIDDGETASLQAVDLEPDVGRRLLDLYADNRPKADPSTQDAYRGGRRRYYYGYDDGSGASSPTQSSGRLEKSMGMLRGRTEGNTEILGPRSYIAVVEQSPEVEHGTNSAEEEQSFHVILGTW